jgi:hypothetical protein
LGSVALGRPQAFTMFNIQAAGTITPDPGLNGASFQLQFLICDQPDCGGQIKIDTRILQHDDSASPTQVLATASFGVTTHNAAPVVLTNLRPENASGTLYLAVALKLVRSPSAGTPPFTGRLNLLRVSVLP